MNSMQFSILAAAGAGAEAPPAWLQFMPLVAMVLIFWFLILRPQMRQQKAHREKVAAVKKGDQVLTGGGILGKVTRVDEHYADVEIAQGTKVKILKSTISDIVDKTAAAPAND
jgi:preprotein translocase subunit YajC